MGKIINPSPVKLIVGFISGEEGLFKQAEACLERKFGAIDFQSEAIPFKFTQYYEKEMGKNLLRKFISFKRLIKADQIAAIKIYANKLEANFLKKDGSRRINIDPGYVNDSKLVLATTKDFTHRLYLRKGIFAETTLFFQGGHFNPWPWTYPDYQAEGYLKIFQHLRLLYMQRIRLK